MCIRVRDIVAFESAGNMCVCVYVCVSFDAGTTAIVAMLRGKTVYVANVGDSRAVVAERQGDRLVAQDLSFDQTPFRWAIRAHIHIHTDTCCTAHKDVRSQAN